MEILVSNDILIRNATDNVRKWCKLNLEIDNPDFYKKQRLGKWTGGTPQKIVLYERNGFDLRLPFGCVRDLWRLFGAECSFKPVFRAIERVNYQSGITLYQYQENAVRAILGIKNGVVVMPCGAGKTQTALEAVARIGGKTLWLTHTQDLLHQSMNRAKACFGIDGKSFGTITGGKVNIGSGMTFATVQTMSKLDLTRYKDAFDVIIVDEAHHAVGSPTKVMQFYKVLSSLSARYKIGLTATPKRADGLERSMFALLGDVIYEVSKEEVKHTTCPVEVRSIKTGYKPDYDVVLAGDGTINYAQLVEDLTQNEERFEFVLNKILECDGPTIVLANRVEYLKKLEHEYDKRHGGFEPSICLSALGNSMNAKRLRKNALISLNEGDIDCVFATYQLAKEGLDCPNLRYLVLATPEKDETTVTQAVGRVGRKADGKDKGVVLDFVDNFGMLLGWAQRRQKYYKKNGYEFTREY